MHNFKELKVWQYAMDLVKEVYQLTDHFPNKEKYALVQQINRAAVSIPSNIAEGAGRTSNKSFYHYLDIALGSSYELETQLLLGIDLEYIDKEEAEDIFDRLDHIQKMIYQLQQRFAAKSYKS